MNSDRNEPIEQNWLERCSEYCIVRYPGTKDSVKGKGTKEKLGASE